MSTTMPITRQHTETDIPELVGATCNGALGVGMSLAEGVTALFLNVGDIWYRIYIDVGVLFWQPGEPDPDVELAEDEEFDDLLERIGVKAARIEYIRMHSGRLHIKFVGPHSIMLSEREEGGLLDVSIQSPLQGF